MPQKYIQWIRLRLKVKPLQGLNPRSTFSWLSFAKKKNQFMSPLKILIKYSQNKMCSPSPVLLTLSLWLKNSPKGRKTKHPKQTNKQDDGQKLAGYYHKNNWLYVVLRPVWEYSTLVWTSTLPVKGCRVRPMQGACSLLGGGIFIVPLMLWHGTSD